MFSRLKAALKPQTLRARRAAAGIGFIGLAMLASVSIFATGPSTNPVERTEKAWPVSVLEVTPAPIEPTFKAYGRVESSNVTHLKTDLNAEVADVSVREGDWVSRGDLLITLDDREIALALLERRAELAELSARVESTRIEQEMLTQSTGHYRSLREVAQKKLSRHQDLMAKRLISQALLDEVIAQASQAQIQYQSHMRSMADFPNRLAAEQAAADRARARLRQAELDMEKTRITAPYGGPVLSVHVAPGDRSSIGATLADVASAAAFEVRLQIPERYGARMHANLEAGLPVTARTPEGTVLTLSRLSGQVKPGQSGLDAFFGLDVGPGAPHTALGRLLELSVTLPMEEAVIALPVQSIYENDRIYAVRTTGENETRLEAITIERVGEAQNEAGQHRVLVRSPAIGAGERIITTQLPRAITGLLVEPA
jgi:multidrug efflux pump subunit AcrA (membrane-fusion protein)